MSESKLLYIVRVGDNIEFRVSLDPDYLTTKYGIITRCIVKDADKKICDNCKLNELKNIKDGETWIVFNKAYFCHKCSLTVNPQSELLVSQNLQKKIPHQIKDVMNDIERHNNYVNIDLLTKMQYETCKNNKTADNNKYIRALWFHLYHGKEMPIG